jgi:hypothetical protein
MARALLTTPAMASNRICNDELSRVCGGMRYGNFRRSTNVEDDRGMTPWPRPQPPRFPGDLPSQAGIDHLP